MEKFTCLHCGQPLESPGGPENPDIICPGCGQTMLVPYAEPAPVKKMKLVLPPLEQPKGYTLAQVASVAADLIAGVERVIVGKREQITLAVATLLAEGHVLLEDVPGVAKTMLARALALSAGCSFQRIQCTPDLQPSDVLGEPYNEPQTGRTEFRFGPIFSNLALVDEINRASPRTQAAMLEAMGEASVTSGRISYKLEKPFMVIATQNPIEQEGTFVLPEAQRDRFLMRLSLGYPSLADEKQMCERLQLGHPIETLKSVTTPDRIVSCAQAVRTVKVGSEVCDYILALVQATRSHPALLLGASPRGSLGLFRAVQAMTAIQGGESATLEQVKMMAGPVLAHRLILRREERHREVKVATVIEEIIERTRIPG